MNVSVENLGPCKKLLRIEVPVEQVNAAFDTVTASFQKQAQLPGFRSGKAPKHMIIKSYESQINDEVRKKLFGDSYAAASSQEKLRVLATLDVEELTFGRGLPFSYTATLENAPEFEVPEYKGLKAQRPVAQPTEADVERALNILREQQVRYNDVARALQVDDIARAHHGVGEPGGLLRGHAAPEDGHEQRAGLVVGERLAVNLTRMVYIECLGFVRGRHPLMVGGEGRQDRGQGR